MGVVQNQTIKNTLSSYIGLVVGYVNFILLYPIFFSPEEFGLVNLIASISIVYSQFSAYGLATIIARYFPFFKTEDKKHNNFILIVLIIAISGFIIITSLYILFRPLIIDFFLEKSSLFSEYFYILIPLSFSVLAFNILEGMARSVFKTSFPVFVKDVLFRILTTAGILLVVFKILSFEMFILYYVVVNALIALILFIYLITLKEYEFKIETKSFPGSRFREVVKFGGFSLLAGSSYFLAENIDKIMIGSMVGLSIVGVYSVFFYMSNVIRFPARSMYRIVVPIIAEAWKNNDHEKINIMYKKTSLILNVIGSILLIGLIINMHNILHFINKPVYNENYIIFIFLGLGALIDVTGGLNSDIIGTSTKFRFDALFNFIYLIACVLFNIILIPVYGGLGAAIATAAAITLFNVLKWFFLKHKYGMQPLSGKFLVVFLISCLTFIVSFYIPRMDNVFVDIFIRSAVAVILYFTLILSLKISGDLNEKFVSLTGKFLPKKST